MGGVGGCGADGGQGGGGIVVIFGVAPGCQGGGGATGALRFGRGGARICGASSDGGAVGLMSYANLILSLLNLFQRATMKLGRARQ